MNKKLVLPVILLTLMLSLVGLTVGRLALSYGTASQWSETVLIEGQVSVQELATCVQPVEYWRAHSACSTNPERSTAWNAIGEDTPFYNTGMTWCEVLWQDSTDPVFHAEQQYIAARLNEAAGVPAPVEVREAVAAIHGWLDPRYEQPYEAIAARVDVLADYHSGALFPYLCEPTDNSGTYFEPNALPVGVEDNYQIEAGAQLVVQASGVLMNDSDADGDPLAAALVVQPQFGSLEFHEDGSFTYQAIESYSGPDSFSYNLTDGIDTSGPVVVTLDVLPTGNEEPTATPTPIPDETDEEPDGSDSGEASPTPTRESPGSMPIRVPEGRPVDIPNPPTPGGSIEDNSQEGNMPGTGGDSITPTPTSTPPVEDAEDGQSGEVEEPSPTTDTTSTP